MSNFFRTFAVAAAITAASLPAMAQQATPAAVLNASIIGTPSGMWVVSATQRASYCMAVMNAGGMPLSKCAAIGTLTPAAAGYFFTLQGSSLMAINRSSGDIFSCTFVLLGGTNPQGNCAAISTLAVLH